jgi:hypothetical protein
VPHQKSQELEQAFFSTCQKHLLSLDMLGRRLAGAQFPEHTNNGVMCMVLCLLGRMCDKATSKPNASPIREIDVSAQDMHSGVVFGIVFLYSTLCSSNAFSDRLDDASGGFGDF